MKNIILSFLKIYKKFVSPIFKSMGVECKYYPTCSEYAMSAVKKYGCIKGVYLSVKRIIKCNPFSKCGYDPLK